MCLGIAVKQPAAAQDSHHSHRHHHKAPSPLPGKSNSKRWWGWGALFRVPLLMSVKGNCCAMPNRHWVAPNSLFVVLVFPWDLRCPGMTKKCILLIRTWIILCVLARHSINSVGRVITPGRSHVPPLTCLVMPRPLPHGTAAAHFTFNCNANVTRVPYNYGIFHWNPLKSILLELLLSTWAVAH